MIKVSAGLISSEEFSPWLVDGHLISVSSHGLTSMCVCVLIFFSYKIGVT